MHLSPVVGKMTKCKALIGWHKTVLLSQALSNVSNVVRSLWLGYIILPTPWQPSETLLVLCDWYHIVFRAQNQTTQHEEWIYSASICNFSRLLQRLKADWRSTKLGTCMSTDCCRVTKLVQSPENCWQMQISGQLELQHRYGVCSILQCLRMTGSEDCSVWYLRG